MNTWLAVQAYYCVYHGTQAVVVAAGPEKARHHILALFGHTPNLAAAHPGDKGPQGLALIQHLWIELKSVRKDSKEYDALVERMRRETDRFRQQQSARDTKPRD